MTPTWKKRIALSYIVFVVLGMLALVAWTIGPVGTGVVLTAVALVLGLVWCSDVLDP